MIIESLTSLENLKWGVAVRNEAKIKEILKEIKEKSGRDLSNIKIISADASDESSLKKMAQKAKVKK